MKIKCSSVDARRRLEKIKIEVQGKTRKKRRYRKKSSISTSLNKS